MPGLGQLSPEDLAGATPVAAAPAAAPAGSLGQLSEEDINGPAPRQVSGLEAVGRGALQGATLGLSDEISGALESLFTSKSYAQARDEARANNAAAADQHNILYGAGELAGGIAPSLIPGAGVAKGASTLAAAGKAALMGGISGLGASEADLTKGDIGGAALDTGIGAVTGGVVGGVLHGIGSKVAKEAPESFVNDANEDLLGRARPKDRKVAFGVQMAHPEIANEVFYGEDFKPVLELARSGKTEEAVHAAQSFVDKAGENRIANYEAASADGAKGTTGSVIQRLRQEASARESAVGGKEEAKAISNMADTIERTRAVADVSDLGKVPGEPDSAAVDLLKYAANRTEAKFAKSAEAARAELEKMGISSSAGKEAANSALDVLKPELPKSGSVTKQDLWDAAIKVSGGKSAGDVPEELARAIESTKFSYDPNAPIPLLRLRQIATQAQKSAVESLGTIAETERARITGSVDKAVTAALDSHLDAAAATSPKAKAAVEAIRHDNKVIAMGLNAKEGLEQRLLKESTGRAKTTADRIADNVKGLSHVGALGALGTGHGGVGAVIAAAPYATKALGVAARHGNDTLARLLNAERMGNNYAKNVLSALRATPQGAARIAALMTGGPHPTEQP